MKKLISSIFLFIIISFQAKSSIISHWAEPFKIDNYIELVNIFKFIDITDYENMTHPGIKKETTYDSESQGRGQGVYISMTIRFTDNYEGSLYYSKKYSHYFISDGVSSFPYGDKEKALNALYVYKRYGKIISKGQK